MSNSVTKYLKFYRNDEDPFNKRIVNLSKFNKIPEKLPNARKVAIYVLDRDYVVTVWAMNRNINRSMVEIRRANSIEWD